VCGLVKRSGEGGGAVQYRVRRRPQSDHGGGGQRRACVARSIENGPLTGGLRGNSQEER
jgi:hypothetical protein